MLISNYHPHILRFINQLNGKRLYVTNLKKIDGSLYDLKR